MRQVSAETIAYHEAAHTVVAAMLGLTFRTVTVAAGAESVELDRSYRDLFEQKRTDYVSIDPDMR
jgi:hypothetical protein